MSARRWRRDREAKGELEELVQTADDDVSAFADELMRFGVEADGADLDESARLDYKTALDAYDAGQRAVAGMRGAAELSQVIDTLAAGRYALACVRARLTGRPVPERRVPCFFDPRHGPSARDVVWTPPGRGTRKVPTCAADADRLARGEAPEVRTITIAGQVTPYWEVGEAHPPYDRDYFVSGG